MFSDEFFFNTLESNLKGHKLVIRNHYFINHNICTQRGGVLLSALVERFTVSRMWDLLSHSCLLPI